MSEAAREYLKDWQLTDEDEKALRKVALSSLEEFIRGIDKNWFYIDHDGNISLLFDNEVHEYITPIELTPEKFKDICGDWQGDMDLPHCREDMRAGLARWRAAIDEVENMLNDRGTDPASG